MRFEEALYLLNLHRGFQTMPLWLVGQIPEDLDPRLKGALEILAQNLAKRFFPDDFKLNPLNRLPYFFSSEEAQLMEIRLAAQFGPLRQPDFQSQLILQFIYPTHSLRLARFLAQELDMGDSPLVLKLLQEKPIQQQNQLLLPQAFVERQAGLAGQISAEACYVFALHAAADGDLPLLQQLWSRLRAMPQGVAPGILRQASLLTAAIAGVGDVEMLDWLLAQDLPFNLQEDEALHQALAFRREPALLARLAQKRNLELPFRCPSPFQLLVLLQHQAMIQAWANLGAPLNNRTDASQPLFLALSRGLTEQVPLLLAKGASLSHAFLQGFGGGEVLLEHTSLQPEAEVSGLRNFLQHCRQELLNPQGALAHAYLAEELPFSRAYEKVCQSEGESFFGTVETVVWVLETFFELSKTGTKFTLQRPEMPLGLAEALIVDCNHLLLACLQYQGYAELIKKTFLELARNPELVILPWQRLIQLVLQLEDPTDFAEILDQTHFFFRFKDGYYEASEIGQPGWWDRLSQQAPALYLMNKGRLDLLGPLLDKQPDLVYWQSLHGDSLLSLAMLAGDEEAIRLLARRGFSITQALKVAIGESNLALTDYLLFWLLRHLRSNHRPYFQAILEQGLDLEELASLTRTKQNLAISQLFQGWLSLFPPALQVAPEPGAKSWLPPSPKRAQMRMLQELANPLHHHLTPDPLEEWEYLLEEFSLRQALHEGRAQGADFFEPHPLPLRTGTRILEKELLEWLQRKPETAAKATLVEGPKGEQFLAIQRLLPHPEGVLLLMEFANGITGLVNPFGQTLLPLLRQTPMHWAWVLGGRGFVLGSVRGRLQLHRTKTPQVPLLFGDEVTELEGLWTYAQGKRLLLKLPTAWQVWDLAPPEPELAFVIHQRDLAEEPLFLGEELVFLDAGSLNQPGRGTWHHLYYFHGNSGELLRERPCPRLNLGQLTPLGQGRVGLSGENRLFQPQGMVFEAQSGLEVSFPLTSLHCRFLAQTKEGNLLLLQQERQGYLLELASQTLTLLPVDLKNLDAACFVHKGQSLALLYRPDPLQGKPGKLVIWRIQPQKALYEEAFAPHCRTRLLPEQGLLAVITREYLLRLFDLEQLQTTASFKAHPAKQKLKQVSPP